ncbi:uncharacterized protein LOC143254232 isoform X2 [Tachypleus tridentatus]|uniref:uncharacterized protein LOC143254232 isoform X2 n=1 Tax=Tachypleus tridentatus TaxID=6853 RepID=UPI003FD292BB
MSVAKATPQLPTAMSVSNTGALPNEATPAIQSSAPIVVSSSPVPVSSLPSHPQQTHTPTTFFTVSSPVSSSAIVTTMGPPSTPAPQPHPQLAPSSLQPQNHGAPQGMQHPTIPNVLPSPLAQVQVIHQPLHNPAYVQQLYTPQQQMLLPGGLTIQSASMAPTLQSLGMAPGGLSLQLQSKGPLDPKTQGVAVTGPTLIPTSPLQTVNTLGKGLGITTGNLVSGPGQVVATGGKSSIPGQVITAKSTTVIQGQSGFVPATTSQTVVIGQLGVLSSQPSILPTQSKGFLDNQKGKSFVMGHAASLPIRSPTIPPSKVINHNTALQPKSPIFPSPVSSVGSTAQVLTSTQLKQLTSSPQLITTQATGAMLAGHSHILGSFQALGAPLGQGITWATPGGLQSPALLAQNPIFIRSQQSDMFIQSSPAAPGTIQAVPVAAAATPGPISATSNHIPKQKQVRPAISVATQTAVSTSVASHSHGPLQRPQVKQRPRTQVNRQPSTGGSVTHTPVPTQTANTQTQTQPTQHQKADAANQTKPTSEVRTPASTQNKSTATETKQQAAQVRPNHISVVPITTAPKTATTATNTVSTATSMSVTPTKEKKEETKMDTKQETAVPLPVPVTNGNHETPPPEKKEEAVKIQEPPPPPPEPIKEKQLQKAIVKPHVLTHVIEGYVIQEGPDPFPISRSSLLTDTTNSKPLQTEKQPKPEVTTSTKVVLLDNKDKSLKGSGEIAKCEFCGKLGPKSKFKRSKRFCSTSCAKRYNVGCSKRLSLFPSPDQQPVTVTGKVIKKKIGYKARKGWRKSQSGRLSYNIAEWNQELNSTDHPVIEMEAESEGSGKAEQGTEENEGEETTDTPSGPESSMSPTTPSSHREEMEVDLPYNAPFGNKNPLKWTVQEVFDFVNGLPGCSDYAEEFRSQEIDGQALMLLKEDHLMSAMSMKLGPALKICSHITSLKDENNT